MTNLSGRTIIITGAGGLIGRAFANAIGSAGANTILADLEPQPALVDTITRNGGKAVSLIVDISTPSSVERMANEVVGSFGRIDGLVNNAGFYRGCTMGSFADIPVDEWDRCYSVNVRGTWLCCKAVFPYMRQQNYGKIVNISSNTPFKGVGGMLQYVSSKAAIIGLSRALAREVGDYGICVNNLCPDLIPDPSDLQNEDGIVGNKRVVAQRCFKRTETAEDVTGALVFLLGPGSDFVTGQSLLVNGGAFFH
ncbi:MULTISPECIES: SDR family oxidoreductase [unclassified Beijerinckia]|uniref:SDR family NAD(P)-dependent oxidoreductase n=1 Tax=unclassified Beijerinckia TaxID=2638183 RepID=UPI00089727A1|nr:MULTISPECIES: SDR family oxidoreductase [unclassified Beijerinckia]MDH7799246.1 NAD(P)-dependent dehydrogenase (short-subunit alcohol dehydrogenase family) [Beijerinckia sp. GAS462]SED90836.1 NAD(P)-dependent dehydrogenase, short-chain alcohol dehydrogenase family [Beijerinckia sp. 28-YEA-48]